MANTAKNDRLFIAVIENGSFLRRPHFPLVAGGSGGNGPLAPERPNRRNRLEWHYHFAGGRLCAFRTEPNRANIERNDGPLK